MLFGQDAKYFEDEIRPIFKHDTKGVVCTASNGPNRNGSQFFITTVDGLHQLDGKHTIFGQVAEGFDTLQAINDCYCDEDGRPLQVIRMKHTIILEDPFPDPPGLDALIPDRSPVPQPGQYGALLDEEEMENLGKADERPIEEIRAEEQQKEIKAKESVLVIAGDMPTEDTKPPDNVIFVCKLNPVTTSEDLEMIFSRFGEIRSCEVIRDWKTGDSLQYAFIEYSDANAANTAVFKMENVLIDDRRIHVDWSQSVSKLVMGKDGRTTRVMNRDYWNANQGLPSRSQGSQNSMKFELKNKGPDSHDMVFDDDDVSVKRQKSQDDRRSSRGDRRNRDEKSHRSDDRHRDDRHRDERHRDDRHRDDRRDDRHRSRR
eukprot:TRINITY_DN8753_c0_g1_i3.p1 TRINITY_DN8753_c0_g1~~TRINITY_DN8753_c0_g1_i3.p1  ORF type:complete len:373 (+),score=129.27 TRINITY_DN8753_c0_g1_i3:252-1370(+)